jgi:hypothetical protein
MIKALKQLTGFAAIFILSCTAATQNNQPEQTQFPIQGTWKLLTGTLVENGNTTVTDYTTGKSFIKIINDTHFAFLLHDLNHGKDSAEFSAGGGKYTLHDSTYTEHLEYCNDRQWEGNDFSFTVTIHGDTLIQQGVEKIDSLGVNRVNTERYVKMKSE